MSEDDVAALDSGFAAVAVPSLECFHVEPGMWRTGLLDRALTKFTLAGFSSLNSPSPLNERIFVVGICFTQVVADVGLEAL